MSDLVVNDDFTALAELLDGAESAGDPSSLEMMQTAVLERVRAEVAAKSDGLRRAIVWYEKLAEDAKRVMKQSQARAALVRAYCQSEMQAAGVRSIKTATGSLTVRGNGGLQPLTLDADLLPDELTKITVTMPHALWSDLCEAFAAVNNSAGDFYGKNAELPTLPGVTIRTEADNERIREALEKPCPRCEGRGYDACCEIHGHSAVEQFQHSRNFICGQCGDEGKGEGADLPTCPECNGTKTASVPGARLEPRGESLQVR